jgi:hypothetical protein
MFINSLEKTGARDTVERFSLAIEKLGPIMAAVLMVPSGLALAAAAAASGFALARSDHQSLFFEAARYLLFAVPIFGIVGPILLPAADRTNPVRLLLLPISRRTLYAAQTSSAFGDVWVLVMLPFVLFLPIGLLAGGAWVASIVALVAGALLVIVVVGISSVTTSVLHLVVRDRRRGELIALLFIVLIPALSMLPGLLAGGRHRALAQERAPRSETMRVPAWVVASGDHAINLYPSELYVKSTRTAVNGEVGFAGACLLALAATGFLLHVLGIFVFTKVLDSPGSTGARRAVPMRAAWARTLPGLSAGASAVALAQLRLALRTPRGRAILLSPIAMIVVFGIVMRRHSGAMDFGPWALDSGVSLAAFGSFICLMSILPIAMNQFAVDKAGLTLALLSPLTDGEYLAGKAVGNALIATGPATISVLLSFVAFPDGSLALWLAIPLSLLATYFLVAPAAAILSAVFPRVVDLNSIGRGSNAHGLAGLLGILSFAAAGAPTLIITFAASKWLGRPSLAPLLLLAWCAITYGFGRLLWIPARQIFAQRRENLAMLL